MAIVIQETVFLPGSTVHYRPQVWRGCLPVLTEVRPDEQSRGTGKSHVLTRNALFLLLRLRLESPRHAYTIQPSCTVSA